MGAVRERWSEDTLHDEDRRIADAEARDRELIATACRALIDRHAATGA